MAGQGSTAGGWCVWGGRPHVTSRQLLFGLTGTSTSTPVDAAQAQVPAGRCGAPPGGSRRGRPSRTIRRQRPGSGGGSGGVCVGWEGGRRTLGGVEGGGRQLGQARRWRTAALLTRQRAPGWPSLPAWSAKRKDCSGCRAARCEGVQGAAGGGGGGGGRAAGCCWQRAAGPACEPHMIDRKMRCGTWVWWIAGSAVAHGIGASSLHQRCGRQGGQTKGRGPSRSTINSSGQLCMLRLCRGGGGAPPRQEAGAARAVGGVGAVGGEASGTEQRDPCLGCHTHTSYMGACYTFPICPVYQHCPRSVVSCTHPTSAPTTAPTCGGAAMQCHRATDGPPPSPNARARDALLRCAGRALNAAGPHAASFSRPGCEASQRRRCKPGPRCPDRPPTSTFPSPAADLQACPRATQGSCPFMRCSGPAPSRPARAR